MHAVPSSLRLVNQRSLLERLLRDGPASRAELAKATGMSPPTVGKLVDELLDRGVLEEVSERNGDSSIQATEANPVIGRPGRVVRLERTTPRFIALQIGVNTTRLARLAVGSAADESWSIEFATSQRAATWVTRLKRACKQLHVTQPWAVVVSVPGVVDEPSNRVLLSPNLHWLSRIVLPQVLREQWPSLPVILVQEIRALALGHHAAEPSDRDFLLVDFGEGLGGAAVVKGRLYQPSTVLSGELGHTPVAGNARLCGCGGVGCVETLVSRSGLIESFRHAHPRKRNRSNWQALIRHIESHGVEPWLDQSLNSAAAAIAGAINVMGMTTVIVTGSITELPPVVMERLQQAVERSAMWARFGRVQCVAAPRRRSRGLLAAAFERVLLDQPEASFPWPVESRRSLA